MGKRCLFFVTLLTLLVGNIHASDGRFTLVIDAGHGGKDAGCVGAVSKEKNLTLKYALAFGHTIERNCPDVKVIYTRTTDKFLELWQRAELANHNKADLFVSVHINALPGGRIAHGVQTYTLGRGQTTGKKGIAENLEVAKRENSVIYLEKDYKQTYQGFDPNSTESNIMFEFIQDKNMERSVDLARYMQRYLCQETGRQDGGAHQNNLAVLRLTSMPGCLLELGFISTPDEETFLNSAEAQDMYCRGFLRAFMSYKSKFFDQVVVPYKAETSRQQEIPEIVPDEYKQEEVRQTRSQQRSVKSRADDDEIPIPPPIELQDSQPAVQTSTAPAAPVTPKPVQEESKPVFKVQILVSDKVLKEGDSHLKGLSPVDYYKEGGMVKYTYGASTDYNEIYRLRKQVLDRFSGAFIIAFKNGEKIDVNTGIREFKQNRNK